MADPSLALQKCIRDRLVNFADVLALVPATAIIDRSGRPELDRCVLIGEGSTTFGELTIINGFADLHIWIKEPGLTTAKEVGSAVIDALSEFPWDVEGFRVSNLSITRTRYLRDPHGSHSHGVVSLHAIMQERAS